MEAVGYKIKLKLFEDLPNSINEGGAGMSWKTQRWVYVNFCNGFDIHYIDKDNMARPILEGGDNGITTDEELIKHIVKLHNEVIDRKIAEQIAKAHDECFKKEDKNGWFRI